MMIRKVGGDPGHGGLFPGARNRDTGLLEKDVTLHLGLEISPILFRNNFQYVMTRERDTQLSTDPIKDLALRASKMNECGVDISISFHINSSDQPDPDYISIWIHPSASETTRRYAEIVLEELVAATHWENGGVRTANFAVLREANMPAMLIEFGFISNPLQAKLLSQPEFRHSLLEAVVKGLCQINGQKYIGVQAPPAPPHQHWAKMHNDELVAAGLLTRDHTATLDKPATEGMVITLINELRKGIK